jgi:hypothetical protein
MLVFYKPNFIMSDKYNIHTIKELDYPDVNLQLKSNDIVYVLFKDNCILDIPLQLRLLDYYINITERKLMRFIFLAAEGVTITKEARDNAILIEEQSMVGASALIVNNLAYKIIANFYMKVNKPKRPLKAFGNEEDAIKWLNTIEL